MHETEVTRPDVLSYSLALALLTLAPWVRRAYLRPTDAPVAHLCYQYSMLLAPAQERLAGVQTATPTPATC